ncbi:MAG TPA: septum site-determining protein MinC [Legionella sp.]|nr:septum site-determining protein MinC [Legionella sp.]
MIDNTLKSNAFKLKGRLYTLTVLQLFETDSTLFAAQLATVVSKAPRLFDNTPVVLDCSGLTEAQLDVAQFNLTALCTSMRSCGLVPVAIQGGNPLINVLAQSQGLGVLNGSSNQDKPWIGDNPSWVQEVPAEANKTKLVTMPVRSGQQIVSKGGDLVVTASVSHGAELLADGNIHVYGALRGRALAGIAGDKQARIFCRSLDAELLSIAGIYRLSDAIEPISSPCQIFIQDERIQIEPL